MEIKSHCTKLNINTGASYVNIYVCVFERARMCTLVHAHPCNLITYTTTMKFRFINKFAELLTLLCYSIFIQRIFAGCGELTMKGHNAVSMFV